MKRTLSLLLVLTLLLGLAAPAFAESPITEPAEEQITDYYNENMPELNNWNETPQTYVICDENDAQANRFSNLDELFRDHFLFPGDTVTAEVDGSTVWYLMLRGQDANNERFVGITDRYATGEGLNTFSFGAETTRHNCYRSFVLDKLEGEVLAGDGSAEYGGTNESPETPPPYHRCNSKMVSAYPIMRKVIYDLNDGIIQYGENPMSVRVSNDEQIMYTYNPVLEGFHYKGWYGGNWEDNGDGTRKATISKHSTRDIYLTATYSYGNTVKFIAGEDATIHCLPQLLVEVEGETDISGYVPVRDGYVFKGWYDNAECIGEPIETVTKFDIYKAVVYAAWEPATAVITWDVDGVQTSETYANGETPVFKGSTDKAPDAQYTYTFTGWTPAVAPACYDATYTAQYSKSLRTYTVTWDVDGVQTPETYPYGETPVFKGSTEKAADRFYTYTFTGWDKPLDVVTADAAYTAQYTAALLTKEPDNQFSDVPQEQWYYGDVYTAVGLELFTGVADGKFAPASPMTRAMLVTVLWRIEGKPAGYINKFDDVKAGKWFTDAIAWAAETGVVTGIAEGKFNPDGNITREQMALILFRYTASKGMDTSERDDLSTFPDADTVNSWAAEAVQWAVAEQLINGVSGKLQPQGNATRAQVATILIRYLKNTAQ